jgi:hypothetical protein
VFKVEFAVDGKSKIFYENIYKNNYGNDEVVLMWSLVFGVHNF